jgi:tRNA (guanine-N7-)-methyltransferase
LEFELNFLAFTPIAEHGLFLPCMGQKKLQRFEAINSFPNVLQYPDGMEGRWNELFKNNSPITIELACGKGEYTVGLAILHPERNYIGVDLKGNRIYVGAKKCLDSSIHNARFLRTEIEQIDRYFLKNEVDEIWITFPDPQLRISRAKKRLTHPRFLRLYQKFLKPDGKIHLKTDSPVLYAFTRRVIELYGLKLHEFNEDLHSGVKIPRELDIRTYYESLDIAQSKKVYYLAFSMNPEILPEKDFRLQELTRAYEESVS